MSSPCVITLEPHGDTWVARVEEGGGFPASAESLSATGDIEAVLHALGVALAALKDVPE